MSFELAFGVALVIGGLMLMTFRPRANPRPGRVLMVLGVLVIAIVLWQIVQQPTFRPDR